jgi:signal transduction histidine kinase/ligand-binding sensor domain-containing protein/DNA-binding response OmpR family regulator
MRQRNLNVKWLIFSMILLTVMIVFIEPLYALSFNSYTQEDGLSGNLIYCINQDHQGWIWIGTDQGLSRFDGYRFRNFTPSSKDSTSIKGLAIRVIYEDRNGNLWIGTENGGLNRFNRDTETFSQPFQNKLDYSSEITSVYDIEEDKAGNLWLSTNREILVIDTTGKVTVLSLKGFEKSNKDTELTITKIQFDHSGKLWVGTKTSLFLYDPVKRSTNRFASLSGDDKIHGVVDLYLDSHGKMWISTDGDGLYVIDPVSMENTAILLKPETERSSAVRQVAEDISGNYWICTRGGLYIYDPVRNSTSYYGNDEREPQSLVNNSVNSVFRDRNGEMWVGTRQGISLLLQSKQFFQNFVAHPSDKSGKYLNSKSVYAIWVDKAQNIWVGTEDGGVNIYNTKNQLYTYLTKHKNNPNSISENCIKAFLDDGIGNLWIGSFHGGIDVLNLLTGKIRHFRNEPSNPGSLISNDVWDFAMDTEGGIWIATSVGVDRYNPETKSFTHLPNLTERERINWIEQDSKHNIWLGSNYELIIYTPANGNITRYKESSHSFLEDSKGRCWVTTFDAGLAQYSANEGLVRYFGKEDGMACNHTYCVLEDKDQNLWISTSNGLTKFDPDNLTFLNFQKKDGIQNNVFCYGAAYKAPEGDMLFGGITGFVRFIPSNMTENGKYAPIVLTELRVLNRKVEIGKDRNAILKKSINVTDHIELNYTQNAFSLEFAALNYKSESNLYSFYLEGLDNNWSEPGNIRMATYNNLYPGEYILHICNVADSKRQTENELKVSIAVHPPFWKTIWFRILLFIFMLMILTFIILFFVYREQAKMEVEFERMKANKINELNNLKLKFFTNISHEIRTPLTLILTPLEKLRSKKLTAEESDSFLDIIYRNTRNLNHLISQLLDFRKLESGNMKLEAKSGDLALILSEIVGSYQSYAIEKGILLKFNSFQKKLIACFDGDVIGKIMNNLLSNALKFTGRDGRITVNLSLVYESDPDKLNHNEREQGFVEISVTDTGIGIQEQDLERIFDRFFQSETKEEQTGTGIGLSFAQELVKLHNGKIFVESKPGQGSTFTFRLPYLPEPADDIDATAAEMPKNETAEDDCLTTGTIITNIMLIVEDNPDVRLLIKDHFRESFQVYEAGTGNEGWALTLKIVPDVIISDVLMPDMDGFEFCKKVKNDERTSHIPLILLTALHSKENVMKGLERGADDYITKPFDLAILQTRIENILSIRDAYKVKYSAEMMLQPKNIMISSPDQKFLQRAISVVEMHVSDPDLDLDQFVHEVGVSRMQLYRKLHALTDMTVKEFIRDIRLKRAAQLLKQDTMTVSEIAYAVGFKDISHFGKCFRQAYGVSAKEYKKSEIEKGHS